MTRAEWAEWADHRHGREHKTNILCTKYQIKYSCLGPDKSLRVHKQWPCLLITLHYSLCIHPGFVSPLHTHIKIQGGIFHPFLQLSEQLFNLKGTFENFSSLRMRLCNDVTSLTIYNSPSSSEMNEVWSLMWGREGGSGILCPPGLSEQS